MFPLRAYQIILRDHHRTKIAKGGFLKKHPFHRRGMFFLQKHIYVYRPTDHRSIDISPTLMMKQSQMGKSFLKQKRGGLQVFFETKDFSTLVHQSGSGRYVGDIKAIWLANDH